MKHWRWILTLLFGVLVALASAQTFQRSLPFLAKPSSTTCTNGTDDFESYAEGLLDGQNGGTCWASGYVVGAALGVIAYDNLESYALGDLEGLKGGDWAPYPYVVHAPERGLRAFDDMEAYSDGNLDGLDSGTGWGGPYADR